MDIEYSDKKVKVVAITAYYKDFDGEVEKWRESYFHLLSWKNTWCIPYEMDIYSTSKHEPYLSIIIPSKQKERVLELLNDLGYREVKTCEVDMALIDAYDIDEEIDYYCLK